MVEKKKIVNMKDWVKVKRSDLMVEECTVTPAIATEWLKFNRHNRPLSQAHVAFLAKQIENNEWQLNGQAIVISGDDDVLDGQHRLHAIIEAGKPVTTLVVYGVNAEAFKTIDTGKVRSGPDVLSLNYPDAKRWQCQAVATAARWSIYFDAKNMSRKDKVSNTEVLDYVHKHPQLWIYAERLREYCHGTRPLALGLATACWHHFAGKHQDQAEEFMFNFYSGEGISAKDAEFHLRNQLLNNLTKQTKWSTVVRLRMMFKAWNAKRRNKGKPVTRNQVAARTSDPAWIKII